jgi:hypothetical protein
LQLSGRARLQISLASRLKFEALVQPEMLVELT